MSSTPAGAVYDRGYLPYEGQRGGRGSARSALWRASVRRALGIRRSWRQKFFPWVLLAIVTVPAVVNVGVAYLTRDTDQDFSFITYREYVGVSTAMLLFVALTAPDVLCPDRRHRVLPLVFSRPLTGTDYVLAKVGAIVAIVFAFGYLPQVLLFVGQMLVSDGASTYLVDHLDILWKVPLAVAALALYYSTLSLAVSSFATRRIVAAASLLISLLVLSIAAGALSSSGAADGASTSSAWGALNLLALPLPLRDVIFEGRVVDGPLAGVSGGGMLALAAYVGVVGASSLVLWWRYRWVET